MSVSRSGLQTNLLAGARRSRETCWTDRGKRTRHPGGRWCRRAGGLSCTKKDGLRKTPRDCLWFDHAYTRFVGPVA
ncbi:hypothetical protein TGVEG_210715 [Toxoplasma gondii VEG]|uniref:Uncharacterized protein n=2 Tax=Toxoplasma gondii TaxID=5811 RepID=V4Z2L3_TOXGV|nr:hypothetical protein TGVEG_210715 [Toxoplasma gondii VEG]KFG43112.1 hypothetical protein TGP89_210715 [Toxoplasma gondii p89]